MQVSAFLASCSHMTKRILDVGQCNPDHAAISGLLTREFDVEIVRAHLPQDTLDQLRADHFDLVLINRKLDADYSDGMDIIRTMKGDPALRDVPVMLVSNYAESQEAAVKEGAEYGFGKAELNSPDVAARLRKILKPR